jgi:hypothetical protein
MPWWGWVALVLAVLAGLGCPLGAVLGGWLAVRDVPVPGDRYGESWAEVRRSVRALWWNYVRGRRSP